MSQINVVPYIDVMLVLLVIFMITAPLLAQGVKVDLPQAATQPLDKSDQEPVVVTVDAQGAMYINVGENKDKPIDAETLVARVAAVLRRRPTTAVLVRGDTNANYGKVVNAMVLLQKAGVANVGLVTHQPDSSSNR
ncbi:MAG: protein TolR [Gammaproteobacteria bacterium]